MQVKLAGKAALKLNLRLNVRLTLRRRRGCNLWVAWRFDFKWTLTMF